MTIRSVGAGEFGYFDTAAYRMVGDRRLECEMTTWGELTVWDPNGIARTLNNYYREGLPCCGHQF